MATAPAVITAVRRQDPWRLQLDIAGTADRAGLVYADERLERALRDDASLRQVADVAQLPGLVGPSIGMPDIHQGYGSTCHGAGRLLSRNQAKKSARGRSIAAELGQRGIRVRSASRSTLAEEMPEAYKDAADVVRVLEGAGLCRRVVKLEPLVVIKG